MARSKYGKGQEVVRWPLFGRTLSFAGRTERFGLSALWSAAIPASAVAKIDTYSRSPHFISEFTNPHPKNPHGNTAWQFCQQDNVLCMAPQESSLIAWVAMQKSALLDGYKRAVADGWPHAVIARQSGVPAGSLRQFMEDSYLGEKYCLRIERWLRKRSYLRSKTEWEIASERIHALLSLIESQAPDSEKRKASLVEAEFLYNLGEQGSTTGGAT